MKLITAIFFSSAYDDEKIVKIYHSMREIMSYDVSGTIANILAGLIPDITKAKILDLAAGSGKLSVFCFSLSL